MDTSNFERIAGVVFNKAGQAEVTELLQEGKVEKAKEYLLVGIDTMWFGGDMTFEDAAGYYNLLDLSPERAAMFRQKNLGVLYEQ